MSVSGKSRKKAGDRRSAERKAARKFEEATERRARMREVTADIIARTPEHIIEPTLSRIEQVMELLGDPQRSIPSVHITGTNGKTSMARMIEALLLEMGLTTGRFTSPHLHDIRERIVLSGEPIDTDAFLAAYEDVMPFVAMADETSRKAGGPQLSFFEVLVSMAYSAFADAPVAAQVVEVGMGGRWDATNVIDAQVAVLGPIAMDHEKYLGTDVTAVASEKVGIIKPGSIVISADQEPDVRAVILEAAGAVGAPVAFEGEGIGVDRLDIAVGGQLATLRGLAGTYPDVFIPLFGEHQAHNAVMALAAVEALVGGGATPLDQDVVQQAFAKVTSPGRAELVRRSPAVLVDAAHNPAAVQSLIATLESSFTFGHTVGLVAMLTDKDAETVLEMLEPVFDEVILTQTSSPRRLSAEALYEIAVDIFGDHRVRLEPLLPAALEAAVELADAAGIYAGVVATGSVFTAAEVRLLLGAKDV